jgi:dTDP-4-amino-4,6-dideoxygalactose transaminase
MKWKIPYIDFGRQYKKQEKLHLANFKKIMLSGDFVLRDEVLKFEKKISSLIGSKYVVSVNSCTDALLLALASKGFKKNSEIITVGHTYVATLAAIKHVGLNPVLADISDDYNINVSQIEKLITKNTKAILPVHLYGHSCDMSSIMKIANKYNLSVIEDCAQSFGAKFKGKYVGTFGEVGCFSLHPLKSLGAAGDGGFIVTKNKTLYEKFLRLRNHGQGRRKNGKYLKSRYDIDYFGFCTRLDNLQAAIVNTKLKKLNKNIVLRNKVAQNYNKSLKDLPLVLPKIHKKELYLDVFNSYVIRTKKQFGLFKFLRDKGVEVLINWPKPLYRHKGLKLKKQYLINNEKICKEIISLPIFPEIKKSEVNYIVNCIKKFFNRNKNN